MGQSKGFPDYVVIIPSVRNITKYASLRGSYLDGTLSTFDYRLVAIEMKRKKGGRLSAEQQDWLRCLNSAGIETFVAKGSDEAIKWIEERLG